MLRIWKRNKEILIALKLVEILTVLVVYVSSVES